MNDIHAYLDPEIRHSGAEFSIASNRSGKYISVFEKSGLQMEKCCFFRKKPCCRELMRDAHIDC